MRDCLGVKRCGRPRHRRTRCRPRPCHDCQQGRQTELARSGPQHQGEEREASPPRVWGLHEQLTIHVLRTEWERDLMSHDRLQALCEPKRQWNQERRGAEEWLLKERLNHVNLSSQLSCNCPTLAWARAAASGAPGHCQGLEVLHVALGEAPISA